MDDLGTHLTSADPNFEPSGTIMWIESSPEKKAAQNLDVAMGQADDKITKLESEQTEAAWNADTLKLAKDASMCAKILQQAVSNERTDRLAKITHIKEQNKIGASIVSTFSEANCQHVTMASGEAEGKLSQALVIFQIQLNPACHKIQLYVTSNSKLWGLSERKGAHIHDIILYIKYAVYDINIYNI